MIPRLILGQYGDEVNGLIQSIQQFLGIVGFLDLGVGQVLRSALYRPLAEKDYDMLSGIMASGKKFYRRLAYGLVGYVIILMWVYPYLAGPEFEWEYTAGLIAAIAIGSFAQYYFGITNEQLLHADQRGYIIYSLQMIGSLLNMGIGILMLHNGRSVQEVKLASSLIFMIRPFVMQLYIRKRYSMNRNTHYSGEALAQKWEGIAQHFSAVVLDGTDTIVLTLMSTLSNISIYSVHYFVITSIQQFYQAATAGIQSAAGALWAKQERKEIERMFSRTEVLLHCVVVFVFSCTALLIVPFVQVYTHGLTDVNYTQPLFAAIFVLAYGIRCLRTPYNIWILAAGHYRQTRVCHITAAGINLVVSILLVSQYGLVGIATGTLVAMVYQTLWMAIYTSGGLMKRPLVKTIKCFVVDAVTAGAICFLCHRIKMDDIGYFEWFVMAVKVGAISLVISIVSAGVFYRDIFTERLKKMFLN